MLAGVRTVGSYPEAPVVIRLRSARDARDAATEAATEESGCCSTGAMCSRSTSTLRPASVDDDAGGHGPCGGSRPAVSITTSQAAAYSSGGSVSGTSSAAALK